MSIFYELNIGWKSKQIVISVELRILTRVGESKWSETPFRKRFAK